MKCAEKAKNSEKWAFLCRKRINKTFLVIGFQFLVISFRRRPINRERNCRMPPKIVRNKKNNYILYFCRFSETLLFDGKNSAMVKSDKFKISPSFLLFWNNLHISEGQYHHKRRRPVDWSGLCRCFHGLQLCWFDCWWQCDAGSRRHHEQWALRLLENLCGLNWRWS